MTLSKAVIKVRVLFDTEMLYLAANGDLAARGLSKPTLRILQDPETERILSAVSLTEIAIKNTTNRGLIPLSYLRQAADDLRLTILPFTPQHAYRLFVLPVHHRDPFDRMLIATALAEDIPIVGSDRVFKLYRGLKVMW